MAAVRRFEYAGTLSKAVRTPDGYLHAPAHMTRSGVFVYEFTDGSKRREWRPPEEVFAADSLATAQSLPLTNDHTWLTAETARQHMRGVFAGGARDGSLMAGMVSLFDKEAIELADRGKVELSAGYSAELDATAGTTPEGEPYDAIQRGIRYNHVAMVDRGRAGPEAAIHLDAADAVMCATNAPAVGGVSPAVHGDSMPNEQKQDAERIDALTKQLGAAEARADKAEAEAKTLQAKLDTANEAKAAAEKARTDIEATIPARVKARVELEVEARKHLGTDAKLDGDDHAVRLAVIEKLTGKKLDEAKAKDSAYVSARFDAETEQAAKKNPALAAVRQAVASGQPAANAAPVTYEDSMRAYRERQATAWGNHQEVE